MVLSKRKSLSSGQLDEENKSLWIEKKIYGAWLGKLIGIRAGAPIENWTSEEIRKTFGKIEGYPVDYDVFAADDDSNGPLYFVRALLDHPDGIITEKQLGDHLLNVICDGTGFFWWGGVGVSTEHTAYDNLRRGIEAPQSGSAQQHGSALAQQIGGQIFSDCWGYVSCGNVKLAADLAQKMSRVTHDKDAVLGGRFVAACIAAAYSSSDMSAIINEGLREIDSDSHLSETVNAVIRMHADNPEEPEKCLQMILRDYGYEQYEGVCPIWTNTAIMVYSMLYGNGSFDRTMQLCAEGGYDTDCNMGNVGSIAGMAYGIENISSCWIEPLHDTLIGSGSLGSLNETTITDSVKMFTRIACRLNGIRIDASLKERTDRIQADFSLPYGVWGFRALTSRYAEAHLQQEDAKLKLIILHGYEKALLQVRRVIMHTPEEIYDCRYQPQSAASLFAGQTLTFRLSNPEKLKIRFHIILETADGKEIHGPETEALTVSLQVPSSVHVPLKAYSLAVRFEEDVKKSNLWIRSFTIDRCINAQLDFDKWKNEDRGLDYGGQRFRSLQGMITVSGRGSFTDKGLCLNRGMIDFGDFDQNYDSISWRFLYTGKEDVQFIFGMKGNRRYQAVHLSEKGVFYTENENENQKETSLNISLKKMKKQKWMQLILKFQYGMISLYFEQGKHVCEAVQIQTELQSGLLGIENRGTQALLLNRCKLETGSNHIHRRKK